MSNFASRKKAAALRQLQIRSKAPTHIESEAPPRFVADVMLGRLAKWLRIAGFDVLYSNRFTDDELVALSEQADRILLSRDTRLLVRKSVHRFVYLESDDVVEQVRQILQIVSAANRARPLTRCLACNVVLEPVPHSEARGRVPSYVFETQSAFKCCPECRKLYWAGTHRQAVLHALEQMF